MSQTEQEVWHKGSCHCGKVTYEVLAPQDIEALDCNCSMCTKKGILHLIVPNTKFRLLTGEEDLSCYTFNTGVAKHLFCKHCGIHGYYIPRSNPDGFDINVRCLDRSTIKSITIKPFDGQNWEQNGASIAHLSKIM